MSLKRLTFHDEPLLHFVFHNARGDVSKSVDAVLRRNSSQVRLIIFIVGTYLTSIIITYVLFFLLLKLVAFEII